jgi:uncharacterized protein YneR
MLAERALKVGSSDKGSCVQISKGSRSGPSQANAEVSFGEEKDELQVILKDADVLEFDNLDFDEFINDLEDWGLLDDEPRLLENNI